MANTHETLTDLFTDIADAIRTVNGSEDSIVADDFPTAISELSSSSVEITLLAEVPVDDYNNTDKSYFTSANGYSGTATSSSILYAVCKNLSTSTDSYEALLIIFAHGTRLSGSTDSMRVDFTNTPSNLNGSVSTYATDCVVAEDYAYAYANTVYALIVNDTQNSYAYAGGTYFPGTGSGSKKYDSDVIFNSKKSIWFLLTSEGTYNYNDGYYAVYGINGLSSIANLLPRNS